jgi:hypothetical protein
MLMRWAFLRTMPQHRRVAALLIDGTSFLKPATLVGRPARQYTGREATSHVTHWIKVQRMDT